MKNQWAVFILCVWILSACTPSTPPNAEINTAIAQTQLAKPTETELPTETPVPTETALPTATPGPVVFKDDFSEKLVYGEAVKTVH